MSDKKNNWRKQRQVLGLLAEEQAHLEFQVLEKKAKENEERLRMALLQQVRK